MKQKNKGQKTTSCGTLTWRSDPTDPQRTQLLLIKQFPHKESWGIPKGHIHDGESLSECATRETREETGLEVLVNVRLPDVQIELKNESKTLVTFAAVPVDKLAEPVHDDPDSEVADARWFNVDQLLDESSSVVKLQTYQASLIRNFIKDVLHDPSVYR